MRIHVFLHILTHIILILYLHIVYIFGVGQHQLQAGMRSKHLDESSFCPRLWGFSLDDGNQKKGNRLHILIVVLPEGN